MPTMSYFQPDIDPAKSTKKARLTEEQARLLETSFSFNSKLDPDRKVQLAQQLSLPARRIAVWYQNKRARWKNQSLELEYRALQHKLSNALADKKRLEKEVERLKEELDKTQEMLIPIPSSSSAAAYSSFSSLSNSCNADEDARDTNWIVSDSKDDIERELYACLYGNSKHGYN